MEDRIQNRIKLIQRAALTDSQYKKCNEDFLKIERQFLEMLPELTETQQDLIWKFINLSNEVDARLLEIACGYLAL